MVPPGFALAARQAARRPVLGVRFLGPPVRVDPGRVIHDPIALGASPAAPIAGHLTYTAATEAGQASVANEMESAGRAIANVGLKAAGLANYIPLLGIAYGIGTRNPTAAETSAAALAGPLALSAGTGSGAVASVAGAEGSVAVSSAISGAAAAGIGVGLGVAVAAIKILGSMSDAEKAKFEAEQAKRQSSAFAQNVIPGLGALLQRYIAGDASVLPALASSAASASYTDAKAVAGDPLAGRALESIFTIVSKTSDYPGFLVSVYNILATPGYYGPKDQVGTDPWGVATAWSFISNSGRIGGIPPVYPWGQGVVPKDQYQAAFAQNVTVPGVVRNPSGNLQLAPLGWTVGTESTMTYQQIQSTPAAAIQAPKVISAAAYQNAFATGTLIPGLYRPFNNDVLALAPGWVVGP